MRKSPLTRARPRVPAKTQLTYLERRARASDPPRKRRARALATSGTTSNVSSRFADIASPQVKRIMNWRKDWRKVFCTLLIVTAEAHRVYDATHPRTHKPGPGTAGRDEQLFVSKTKSLQPNFNTEGRFGWFSEECLPLVECPTESTRTRKPSRLLTLK